MRSELLMKMIFKCRVKWHRNPTNFITIRWRQREISEQTMMYVSKPTLGRVTKIDQRTNDDVRKFAHDWKSVSER